MSTESTPLDNLKPNHITQIPSEITEPRCGGTSSRAETDTVESLITRAHWRDAQIHVTSKEISRANAMGSHWLTRRVAPLPNLAPKSRTTSQCSPDKTRPPSTEDEFYLGSTGWSYDSWEPNWVEARRDALANENPLHLHVIFLSRSRESARRASGLSLSVTLLYLFLLWTMCHHSVAQ